MKPWNLDALPGPIYRQVAREINPDATTGTPPASGTKPHSAPCVVLSIDPGKMCGLALIDLAADDGPDRIRHLEALPFGDTFDAIDCVLAVGRQAITCAAVVIEDTRQQPIHIGKITANAKAARAEVRRISKIARDVGRIDCMIDILCERAAALHIPTICVPPRTAKWDARRFKVVTGWEARTNQHIRDAVRNAWPLTPSHVAAARRQARSQR